jgi:hypothetical protein
MPTTVKTIGELPAFQTPGKFVEETLVNAPNTAIINRAKVSTSLKPIMGNERIHINSLNLLPNEFGPNGESVYESDSGDARIRFIGNTSVLFDANGTAPELSPTNENELEVVFYGTGINILFGLADSTRTIEASIDGGPFSDVINFSTKSNALNNRNHKQHHIANITANEALDFHILRVRSKSTASFPVRIEAVEILNENSQIVVPAGTCYSEGQKIEVSSAVLDYNAGFENEASIGLKGGRAVIAVDKEDGVVKKWFTKTDPTATVGNPAELVVNGTFDTDLSGWRQVAATWVSGKARVNSGGGGTRYLAQEIAVTPGQKYTLSVDVTHISNTGYIIVTEPIQTTNTALDPGSTNLFQTVSQNGTNVVTFTPTQAQVTIMFGTAVPTGIVDYDNVSVKESAYDFLALGDTDHSEESVYRRINFREFGRNRGDDFYTLGGGTSDRAFTLDDGTTTLVADDAQALTNQGLDTLCTATTNDSFIVTFVGTGLDVYGAASADSADQWQVYVDGTLVGTTFFQGRAETLKICSGLSYGTHTVKFVKTVHSVNGGVHDFIVYQPKKPTLPEGAVELGLLGNFFILELGLLEPLTLPQSMVLSLAQTLRQVMLNTHFLELGLILDGTLETLHFSLSWTVLLILALSQLLTILLALKLGLILLES